MPNDDNLEEQLSENNANTDTDATSEVVNLVELLGLTEIPVNIPIEFLFVYNKLLLVMIELGESMLLDCNSLCNNKNMPIIECYHMFKAAVAAKQVACRSTIGDENVINYYNKLANTLLNYVKNQLNCITQNYNDDLSFALPLGSDGLVNLFITKNGVNTEVLVDATTADIIKIKELLGIVKTRVNGSVVTSSSENTYGLTTSQLLLQRHWHVATDNEFIPGTSRVHINGIQYFLDSDSSYHYQEWIVTNNNISKGVGIILLSDGFSVENPIDEIHVEAELYKQV